MKFVVFGAGGFLGKNLVNYLQSEGEFVYPIDRISAVDGIAVNIAHHDEFGKLNDIDADIVINCASALPCLQSLSDPVKLRNFYDTNVVGGANIANWAASKRINRLINCSTLTVVGKPWPHPLTESANTYPGGPHAAYCSSKLAQELVMSDIALQNNIQLIHLRLAALYGPGMKWDGILAKLISETISGSPVNLTNGNRTYFNFLHILDLSGLIYKISKVAKWENGIYNTASDEEISLFDLASMIRNIGESKSNIVNTDNENLVSRAQVDLSKLLHLINCRAFSFKSVSSGVAEMIINYKKTQ